MSNTATPTTTSTSNAGTQTHVSRQCLSPLTCLELINHLTEAQVNREMKLLPDAGLIYEHSPTKKKKQHLKQYLEKLVKIEHDKLTETVQSLTDSFSRHVEEAGHEMKKLQETVADSCVLLASLTQTATPPITTTATTLATSETTRSIDSADTGTVPYVKFDGVPFSNIINMDLLEADTVYDKVFDNRKVAYYGDVSYQYSGGHHAARPLSENPYLEMASAHVSKFCSEQGIDFSAFNSVMITRYDYHDSCIPPHSDDEPSIMPDSMILTVSLGATRQVVFRRKPPGPYSEYTFEAGNGDAYIMSRQSQDLFDHAVPRMNRDTFTGPRVSITFRALRHDTDRMSANGSTSGTQGVDQTTAGRRSFTPPRRSLLILSDSKNRSFDCSLFKDPVVAFKRDLFFLKDLHKHRDVIENSDIVLISAGINDITKNRADAITLHDHVKHFISQFKNTQFLFDSVSPVSLKSDRFNHTNDCIDKLNEYLFKFSLRTENFKLFDNLSFGLPHLARDGLHLNFTGKSVLSSCWVNCVLIRLGIKRGNLPIRHQYLSIFHDFHLQIG